MSEHAHTVTGEPFDAEAHEVESAEHDKFLLTYDPVITRLPEALKLEREAQAEEQKAERVKTLVADLGISYEEAHEQVYGPSEPAEPAPETEDEPVEVEGYAPESPVEPDPEE